jgi:hypothetical protein
MKLNTSRNGSLSWVAVALSILVFGLTLPASAKTGGESAAMQATRTIALAMFQYANDHSGKYPDGSSSTEVFQKLLDGNYVADPALFYVPLDGKTKGRIGERLRAENVCFDVTGGAGLDSPQALPLVFFTGFKVDYKPGGKAVSLISPYPPYEHRTWWEWWQGEPESNFAYLGVVYLSNDAYAKMLDLPAGGNGYVHDFVPQNFDAHGQTYRQLTPEGVLK